MSLIAAHVDHAIYDRFYEGARRVGLVWTLEALGHRDGLMSDDDENDDPYTVPLFAEHGEAIRHVLEMEIAIFVFRRLNGCWGEVIDGMRDARGRFINKYREKTGYQIDTDQENLIW